MERLALGPLDPRSTETPMKNWNLEFWKQRHDLWNGIRKQRNDIRHHLEQRNGSQWKFSRLSWHWDGLRFHWHRNGVRVSQFWHRKLRNGHIHGWQQRQ